MLAKDWALTPIPLKQLGTSGSSASGSGSASGDTPSPQVRPLSASASTATSSHPFRPHSHSFSHSHSHSYSHSYSHSHSYDHSYDLSHSHSHSRIASVRSFLRSLGRLVLFHLLNACLGFTAALSIVTGVALSLVLLPLCCLGLVILRSVLAYVAFLAACDVALFNLVAPPRDRILLHTPRPRVPTSTTTLTGPASTATATATSSSGSFTRLTPDLASGSSGALLVSFYFVTIKFMVAAMSGLALLLAFGLPLAAAVDADVGSVFFESPSGVVALVVLSAVLAVLGVGFLNFTASLSLAATRFFCCEKWSLEQQLTASLMGRSYLGHSRSHSHSNWNSMNSIGYGTSAV